ncbi:MAG TPA: D-alanyl-D-alanine carboxypeptidase/D-alanyl-D-alanine-endopeptidase [Myxococcota bacterium]|nr:D-alanyl-D-alanine carboxypeptidase/D-alanyl-D-alanine-endopeptidase [Myxococcota bacterium]
MRRVSSALALALALGGSAGAANLESRLDAALRAPALRDARIGVLVVSERDGRVIYERGADRALIPASNQKILTALAALSAWGPAHRFVTSIFADALPDADGAVGQLAVRGGGDPALTSEELWRLAADLRLRGIRSVRGGLLLDGSAFDAQRWHPSWGDTSARAYHGPVSALAANYSAFSATVEAGRAPGEPVRVRIDPPIPYLRLSNLATTGGRKAAASLAVDRRADEAAEEVVVSGVVRAGSEPTTIHRSVLDPVRYAGSVLRSQLEANGIPVAGDDRVAPVPASMRPVLEFEGKSLADVVQLFLKYSNNPMGEMLVKALGARGGAVGSWPDGIAAVRSELEQLGVDLAGLAMVDGSGLSYDNRVTPRTLVSALRVARDSFRFGPEFLAALPIAAADGTLEKRTGDAANRVRAKTGLLTQVTSLSGFAVSADGEPLVFSILVNGFTGSDEAAMDAVDRFAAEIANGLPGPAAPASDQCAR